jgi:tripartite-type tricarboxylate transporter receptor subunit TctC
VLEEFRKNTCAFLPDPDLLSGQVQAVFAPIATAIEYIRAGNLRALAG